MKYLIATNPSAVIRARTGNFRNCWGVAEWLGELGCPQTSWKPPSRNVGPEWRETDKLNSILLVRQKLAFFSAT